MGKLVLWVLLGLGSLVGWLLFLVFRKAKPVVTKSGYSSDTDYSEVSTKWIGLGLGAVFLLVLLISVGVSSVLVVPTTSAAVLKTSLYGTMRYVGPGWKFKHPLFETATIYDLQVKEFQIGEPNEKNPEGVVTAVKAVEADSSSPGRPIVYLTVTGRFRYSTKNCPGPECDLVTIERKYGKGGWESLVKDRMEMVVREIAGKNPYNYVGDRRDEFAQNAYERLKEELDGLANIEFVGIPWYDFSKFINDQLDKVAEQEQANEQKKQEVVREQLETQRVLEVKSREVESARAEAEQQKIREEGNLVAAEIAANADAKKRQIAADTAAYERTVAAQADAEARLLAAQAEANAIKMIAEAEANGFRQKISAFGNAKSYVDWTQASRWQGDVPQTVVGNDGVIPLLNLER